MSAPHEAIASGDSLVESRTVADALLELLRAWGVGHLFTCPGSTEAAVLDALVDRDEPQLILTTHEGVTVSMADGLARATGAPTVAYLHANVGLTNGLSNLYAAQLAYSPVVVLNGLKPTSIQGRRGFTTARRTRELVSQFVKDDWQSLNSESVVEDVHRAFTLAGTAPTGPVWVGLSQDLIERSCTAAIPDVGAFRFDSRTSPPLEALDAAIALLAAAKRPVLIAGTEVGRAGANAALVVLSERLGAPVVMEERRGFERPAFPTDHPNFHGIYSPHHPSVRSADALFFVGARMFNEFETEREPAIPPGALVLHSHPDARQIAHIHGVDAGLVGDQALILDGLIRRLPEHSAHVTQTIDPNARSNGRARRAGVLSPASVVEVIAEMTRGGSVVSDATTAGGLLQQHLEQRSPDDLFATVSGSLGWGVGAALGIKLGLPKRHVTAVLGDGVFQFGMPALWTAARYAIPVSYVVLNNQRYAAVGAALRRFGRQAVARDHYPGTDIAGPRIADISAGFGVPAERVETLADLKDRLEAARHVSHPTLIEVMTDPSDFGP